MQGITRTVQEDQTGTKGADLQADLQQVDEPAKFFDDLVALLHKLVRPDDLPSRYGAPTASTRKQYVRTFPSRPFSSYSPTHSESTAVSFVMCSITVCWLSSVPANLEFWCQVHAGQFQGTARLFARAFR